MVGRLATDQLWRTSPRRTAFSRRRECSTPRASPRLPEGAGRSLDRSSAASDVPRRLVDATRSVPTPRQRRCSLRTACNTSTIATVSMLPRLFVRTHVTRRAACRTRVRNSTALHSRTSFVVPHPSKLESSSGRLSPSRRNAMSGSETSHPVHPYGSDDFPRASTLWPIRPGLDHPLLKELQVVGRHVGSTVATHLLRFQRRAPASRAFSGSILLGAETPKCFTGGDSLHGDSPKETGDCDPALASWTFAETLHRASDTAVASPMAPVLARTFTFRFSRARFR